jgi:hypothetical protein
MPLGMWPEPRQVPGARPFGAAEPGDLPPCEAAEGALDYRGVGRQPGLQVGRVA